MKGWTGRLLLLLMLLALALRVHDLEVQSLWSDEGLSLYRSGLGLGELLSNIITVDGVDTTDTNPPFYFLLLHLWRSLAGDSVFAMRYLGVLAGLLSVPLIYILGKRAFGDAAGLGAALLITLSPFHVWQCQEMRNYSLLLFLNLLSVYALFRLFPLSRAIEVDGSEERRLWLAVWALSGLLGIYTHYFGFFVFAFGALALLVRYLRQRWSWLLLAALGVALVPVALAAYARFTAGQQVDFVPVPIHHLLSHAASVYSVGMLPTIVQPLWRVLPVVALAALGLALGLAQQRSAAWLLLGYQLIPLGMLVVLSTVNPLYNGPRHLFIGLPPFLLLTAAGITLSTRRWRWLTMLLGAGVLLSQATWLKVQFTSPSLIKDDVKGAAAYLNAVARPDDRIVLHDTLIGFVFDYYYQGAAPWTAIPAYGQFDREAIIARLQNTGTEAAGRLWFLTEPTPRTGFLRHLLDGWAAEQWSRIYSRRFDSLWLNVKLEGYLPHETLETLPTTATAAGTRWSNGQQLMGYQITASARPDEPWWPVFYWSGSDLQVDPTLLSLRLLDQDALSWGQFDRPLKTLDPNLLLRHEHEAALPAGLPPGEYRIELRLLVGAEQRPVALNDGGDAFLLPDRLQVASVAQGQALWPGSAVQLVDAGFPDAEYRPGHPIPLALAWRTRRQPADDYRLRLRLVDEDGVLAAEAINTPTRSDYATSHWQPGEFLLGQAGLLIPPLAPAGRYALQLSLVKPEDEHLLPIMRTWPLWGQKELTLGTLEVKEWPLVTQPPPMESALEAELGAPALAALRGYDLASSNGGLALTLYWLALRSTETNYAVLVHLTGADGQIVAQGDGIPAGGLRPTTTWRPGEYISDTHLIPLPTGVPDECTPCRLWVGLYSGEERLPLFDAGVRQPADRLLLAAVEDGR